jgi:hypothetical protein
MPMTTRELLAKYAILLNDYGPDSDEAMDFLNEHCDSPDFVELAALSRSLKKALTAPAVLDCEIDHTFHG